MKNYDLIYVNGDSYSAPDKNFPVYSQHLETLTGIPTMNRAVPGSNNYRIIRSTINDLLIRPRDRVLCIIGFSFVTRDEIWYEGSNPSIINKIPDLDDQRAGRLITADFVTPEMPWNEAQDILIDININRQLAHFYANLFCFVNTLQNLNVDYFIFSAADNRGWSNEKRSYFDNWPMYQRLDQDPKILHLHNFNIGTWASENRIKTTNTRHLLADGHERFAYFILNRLNNFNS